MSATTVGKPVGYSLLKRFLSFRRVYAIRVEAILEENGFPTTISSSTVYCQVSLMSLLHIISQKLLLYLNEILLSFGPVSWNFDTRSFW